MAKPPTPGASIAPPAQVRFPAAAGGGEPVARLCVVVSVSPVPPISAERLVALGIGCGRQLQRVVQPLTEAGAKQCSPRSCIPGALGPAVPVDWGARTPRVCPGALGRCSAWTAGCRCRSRCRRCRHLRRRGRPEEAAPPPQTACEPAAGGSGSGRAESPSPPFYFFQFCFFTFFLALPAVGTLRVLPGVGIYLSRRQVSGRFWWWK